jgi:hypothetical protein
MRWRPLWTPLPTASRSWLVRIAANEYVVSSDQLSLPGRRLGVRVPQVASVADVAVAEGPKPVARGQARSDHASVKQYRSLGDPLGGADVALIGLFSAKEKQYEARLDELAAVVEARGGRVVARFIQRRGASDRWKQRPGGSLRMSQPFSRRTLLTHGKVREIAQACREAEIDAAVFVNTLTHRQRSVLAKILGCLILSGEDLV